MQADNPGAEVSESKDLERDGWERFERTYTVEEVEAKLTERGWWCSGGPTAAVRELWLADVWMSGYATARDMKTITRDADVRSAGPGDAGKVEVRGWVHREVRGVAGAVIGSRNDVEAGRRQVAAEIAQERHAEQAAKADTTDAPPVVSEETWGEPLPCGRGSLTCSRPDTRRSCHPWQRHPPVVSPEETPVPPAVVAAEPSTRPVEGVGNPQSLSEALKWLRGLERRYNERVTRRLDSGESVNDPAIRYLMGKADGLARAARALGRTEGVTLNHQNVLRVVVAPCPTCKATLIMVGSAIRGRAVVHITDGKATITAHLRDCSRWYGSPCCDLHGPHCELPGDLCCPWCVEADHPAHTGGGGTICVLAVDHG